MPLPCRLLPCRPLHSHSYRAASYRAAPSTVTPTVGIGGWPYLFVGASWFNPSQRPRPVNARDLTLFLLISLCP